MTDELVIGHFICKKRRGIPAGIRMDRGEAKTYQWYAIRSDEHFEEKRPTREMIAYVAIRLFTNGRWQVQWERGQRSGQFFHSGSVESCLHEAAPRAFGQTIWRTGPVFV